jgi:hypothetical protein
MEHEGSVVLDPAELLRFHCNNKEAAVGEPTQARWLVVGHFKFRSCGAGHVCGDDSVAMHVTEPEPFLVPARTLGEPKTVNKRPHREALSGKNPLPGS